MKTLKMKQFGYLIVALIFVVGCAKQTTTQTTDVTQPAVDAIEEIIAVEHHGIDLSNMDTSVSPADDFFKYVNGKWLENTKIPDDQGRWGSFNELRENNNKIVLEVLKGAASNDEYTVNTDQRKAANFYAVGMDSLLAEEVGIKPLKPHFDKIDAIANAKDLQKYLSYDGRTGGGAFYSFQIFADLKNSTMMATYLGSGGLGLPDRDYYTKTDEKSKDIRAKYLKHVAKMMRYIGVSADEALAQAQHIMTIETALAEASLTNVERRNIPALYNKMSLAEVSKITPSVNWKEYLTDLGVNNIDTLIVTEPKFMKAFEKIVATVPVAQWKEYLRWRVIDGAANFLNHEIVQANFDFFGKELNGTATNRARWKRVLGMTNGVLGEAIGKLYVDEAFPPEAKATAKRMVDNILLAMGKRIENLDWMTDSTKQMALKKLASFTVKIGYPDEWKGYEKLNVVTKENGGSYVQNVITASEFGFQRQIDKLGKPVNKKEWGMNPQTVNAYYNPLFNEIVFPAAILQPPFFDYQADDAVNYGGIGAVIGHEISHGFDDQGSRFDASGNMVNWWSKTDEEQFKARTGKLIAQYDAFEPLDSVFVNGAFTLGENIGDLGGISVAYDALQQYLTENGRPGLIDGFTPEQRFFLSWGTIWRIKYRDDALRTQVNTDPHSPGMYRASGPLSNLPQFYKAFNVKEGDGMYRSDSVRVVIW